MFQAFIIVLSGSWYSKGRIIVFFLLLYSYPEEDRRSDGNMLVINNVLKHISYIYICWIYYVSVISSLLHNRPIYR